ncbi:uncharacterized protein V1513DRAFT_459910 [Lipomyces chichibuensis]|uniref:uncharacterized protein n=1 Tax=Lipomyces chichibuensis TaxID=1546026 RepID=UPI0033437903
MLEEQPIALPQLRASVQIGVPPQPGEPPSDQDLAAARTYSGCLGVLRDGKDSRFNYGGLSDDSRPMYGELMDAFRYLDEVKQRIRAARGDPLQDAQTDISRRLDTVVRTQNLPLIGPRREREENRTADGEHVPFRIVPFNDGSMPTEQPINLPPLYTLAAIEELNFDQLRAYCAGYGVGAGNTAQMRVKYNLFKSAA